MPLTLSDRELELIHAASDSFMDATSPSWWSDVCGLLLELFRADHAMCKVPSGPLHACNVDERVVARLGGAFALSPSELRRVDPVLLEVEAAGSAKPHRVWSRTSMLLRNERPGRRSPILHDVMYPGTPRDSINIDVPTAGAALCISFERPVGKARDRAVAIMRLLLPAFVMGVRAFETDTAELIVGHGLTRRELQVALLLAARRRNHEISSRLGISEHTVRHHLESIFAKLGVRSRDEVGPRLLRRPG